MKDQSEDVESNLLPLIFVALRRVMCLGLTVGKLGVSESVTSLRYGKATCFSKLDRWKMSICEDNDCLECCCTTTKSCV
jgi:hypothetical protein